MSGHLYHRLYQCPSGPVHPHTNRRIDATHDESQAYGVPGARSLSFAAPGPMCAEVSPLASARIVPYRVAPARFRAWGQGRALAPRRLQGFSGSHTIERLPPSGRMVRCSGLWVFNRSPFSVWTRENLAACAVCTCKATGESRIHRTPCGSRFPPPFCSCSSASRT